MSNCEPDAMVESCRGVWQTFIPMPTYGNLTPEQKFDWCFGPWDPCVPDFGQRPTKRDKRYPEVHHHILVRWADESTERFRLAIEGVAAKSRLAGKRSVPLELDMTHSEILRQKIAMDWLIVALEKPEAADPTISLFPAPLCPNSDTSVCSAN